MGGGGGGRERNIDEYTISLKSNEKKAQLKLGVELKY